MGNQTPEQAEKFAEGGTNCRSNTLFPNSEGHHFIGLFIMAWRLLIQGEGASIASVRSFVMLPAIGAASLALEAIQSLTSSQPSSPSQPAGIFGPALADAGDTSSSPDTAPVSGFSSAKISSDNINALLDAQSLDSGRLTSDSSQSQSASASSAYSAINQLTQSAVPLGLSPVSLSV
jgi:hypothetical protein